MTMRRFMWIFLAITLGTDQPAFLGVALAFITLGVVFLAKQRKDS